MENNLQDRHLLLKIAKGCETSFDEFYNKYAPFVHQIAQNILKDRLAAEDVTHDIFLDIYEKPQQYNPKRGSIKAWLAVKTRNLCIDYLRKKKPLLVQKLELMNIQDDLFTEVAVLLNIEKELIVDALKDIPEKQREAIYEAYFKGKSQVQLAKKLNRPLGTVKSLIRYGLRNLQKHKQLIDWLKTR